MNQLKIVILDGFAVSAGDLSWDCIARFGALTVYERCPQDDAEIIRRTADAEIVITNKICFSAAIMAKLPKLKLIALPATGYNNIDVEAAKARGIAVCNVPGYSTYTVAQHTFALILELFSAVSDQSAAVHNDQWCKAPDFTFYLRSYSELFGKTLGIFGFGTIGQAVAKIGSAFGMKVLYHSRTPKPSDLAELVSLEELFRKSDALTLHAPLNEQTKYVISAEHLAWMKPSAYLINTARGGLVDEAALAEALNNGRIAGAGVDVLSQEPPKPDNPLLHAANCIITPHTAWASVEARRRLLQTIAEIIDSYLKHAPVHQVNP